MSKKRIVAGAAAALLAIATIGGYEGLRTKAYPDIIGVWTVCYGETKGVSKGQVYTKAQCDAMFQRRLGEFETGMQKCLTKPDSIPDKPYVAFLSLAYNIGTGAFCKSTVVRKANAGDLIGACNAIHAFNKAGGRVVGGLVKRRAGEVKMCLSGLPAVSAAGVRK